MEEVLEFLRTLLYFLSLPETLPGGTQHWCPGNVKCHIYPSVLTFQINQCLLLDASPKLCSPVFPVSAPFCPARWSWHGRTWWLSSSPSWGTPLHSSKLFPPAPHHSLPSLSSQLNHSCVGNDALIAGGQRCSAQVSLAWESMVFKRPNIIFISPG